MRRPPPPHTFGWIDEYNRQFTIHSSWGISQLFSTRVEPTFAGRNSGTGSSPGRGETVSGSCDCITKRVRPPLAGDDRRIGLDQTNLANAACDSIRLVLIEIGALVSISVRRIRIAMVSGAEATGPFLLERTSDRKRPIPSRFAIAEPEALGRPTPRNMSGREPGANQVCKMASRKPVANIKAAV